MKEITKSIELGGRTLTLATGKLAAQADSAVLAKYGDTVVLATVVASRTASNLGYFPLIVEYMERLYAGGRIKGSRWVKREGRSTDEEILAARLIDRSVRPLFPKEYMNEVQVIVTVLSVDLENDPSIIASVATSAALALSPIPWDGPIGTVKVGYSSIRENPDLVGDESNADTSSSFRGNPALSVRGGRHKDNSFFVNPLNSEIGSSSLDLVVSASKEAVLMIEAGAKEVIEKTILEGVEFAQKEIGKIVGLIDDLQKEVGKKKDSFEKLVLDQDLKKKIESMVKDQLDELIKKTATRQAGEAEYQEVREAVIKSLSLEEERTAASAVVESMFREMARKYVLSGKRADGRALEEVRPLSAEVGVLPRTHGSAIFQRGQTQVLSVATLGSPSLGQLFESAEGEEEKHYIHHYSMPPYSTGETGRVGFPNRREIGHGALAERAIVPVVPSKERFPYTIRVVTEVLSSNGSTSMASVCGSTLALMDAGVPIAKPISGIAMGLVIENDKEFKILSDITGFEDMTGDMDFKVAGTEAGITAMQLDVKTSALSLPILEKALDLAKEGRAKILKVIVDTIGSPRESVSRYAPVIKVIKVAQDKIGEVIGPGGRMIRKIISDTGAQIEVEDDGSVSISGTNPESVASAVSQVEALTKEVAPGEIYKGTVKRIQPFGAFVEVLPGKEGLVHVSDMSADFVKDPNDKVRIGEEVQVRVKEIDSMGRINLSMLLEGDKVRTESREVRGRGFRRDHSHGPSFPASRFVQPSRRRFSR